MPKYLKRCIITNAPHTAVSRIPFKHSCWSSVCFKHSAHVVPLFSVSQAVTSTTGSKRSFCAPQVPEKHQNAQSQVHDGRSCSLLYKFLKGAFGNVLIMVAKWPGPVWNSETIVLALLEPAGEIKHPEKRWGTEERRKGVGLGVDLKGLDGGLECVAGEGVLFLSFLNEKSARAVGGTQCVVVLWGHVVCISEDRVSGTSTESGWCTGSLGCVRLRGYRTFGFRYGRGYESPQWTKPVHLYIFVFRCM